MKKYISLTQAGGRSSRSVDEWQALCQAREIDCRQHNNTWFVAESCLAGEPILLQTITKPDQSPVLAPVKKSRRISQELLGVLMVSILLIFISQVSPIFQRRSQIAVVALNQTTTTSMASNTPATTTVRDSDFSFQSLGQILDYWWQEFSDLIIYLVNRVTNNWNIFLGLTVPAISPGPLSDESNDSLLVGSATSSDLQKVIDDRIKSQLKNLLGSGTYYTNGSGSLSRGVVVVPSTGNAISDAAIRERIGDTFSDQVSVRFDVSGITGVITPIFQKTPNDNYIFMITPMRQP